ncbi:hypothetical protein CNYM01_05745 [Colletotrichum nymphaeae SA-01]|uniref:Uncharacterized protein n=1 Tax=Colletotrichum nymphaeae SA-01 TaxID=1460502 RepID=A0A135T1Q1_9PEZI|nr:hypothetical protein CNYM01_05745 [Colletotrichum nymphaeae SA-01]
MLSDNTPAARFVGQTLIQDSNVQLAFRTFGPSQLRTFGQEMGDFTRRFLSGQSSHRSPEPGSACGSEQGPTKTAVQTDSSGPGEWVAEGPPLIRTPGGWRARAYRLRFPHPAPRLALPPTFWSFLPSMSLLHHFRWESPSKTNDSSMSPALELTWSFLEFSRVPGDERSEIRS